MSFVLSKAVNSNNNPRKGIIYIQYVMAKQFNKRHVWYNGVGGIQRYKATRYNGGRLH
jgi:hypothetical protein